MEEDVPALDIVLFARAGLFLPGDHAWELGDGTGGGRPLRVITLDDVIEIRMWGSTLGEMTLDWSECNYGGKRPWWLCPRCGTRRRKLYLFGGNLRCRSCCDLGYGAQLERDPFRGLRRARRIRERLGGRPALVEPFPRKPKRMRWATYDALRDVVRSAEEAYLASVGKTTARLRHRRDVLVARAEIRPR